MGLEEGEPSWQEEAETFLPTQGGFFFGDIGYNEWYLNQLTYTIREIARVLTDYKDDTFVYYAWY